MTRDVTKAFLTFRKSPQVGICIRYQRLPSAAEAWVELHVSLKKKCVLLYFKREKNTSDLTTPARNGLLSMVKLEILFQHQLPLNYRHRAKLTKYFSKSKPEPPIRTKECQCLNEHSISGYGRIKGRDIPDYVPDFLCGALVALVRWAPFLKET